MSNNGAIPEGETGFDSVLAFAIPERHARGRIVRLGSLLDTVLSAHDYPAAIRHLLAEALVITALAGSLLKDQEAQLTIQAQTDGGIVELLVCDFLNGALRGYVRHDAERLVTRMTYRGSPGRSVSITVLGSTGSVGTSTLDVLARHPERFTVFALTAARQVEGEARLA